MRFLLALPLLVAASVLPLIAADPPARATVVAEGVGTTADEATKDALRNAVRQVVGAVVDAETLVKSDQVISDKVLTYSDGFVKTYKELSKTDGKGLIRVRIAAEVERRSVVAKLKEEKVKVTAVDGQGLFAEAVTDADAAKNAKELLAAALKEFPNKCLSATVIGKPVIVEKNEKTATVRFDVELKTDLKAYQEASDKFAKLLDKIARDKGEFGVVCKEMKAADQGVKDSSYSHFQAKEDRNDPNDFRYGFERWMPKAFAKKGGFADKRIAVAVGTQRSATGDRIEYRYFLLDDAVQPALAAAAYRVPRGKLTLTDSDGKLVSTDRFGLEEKSPYGFTMDGTMLVAFGNISNSPYIFGMANGTEEHFTKEVRGFVFSPTFVERGTGGFQHRPALVIPRTLTLTLDELKAVQAAKVEIIDE